MLRSKRGRRSGRKIAKLLDELVENTSHARQTSTASVLKDKAQDSPDTTQSGKQNAQ